MINGQNKQVIQDTTNLFENKTRDQNKTKQTEKKKKKLKPAEG